MQRIPFLLCTHLSHYLGGTSLGPLDGDGSFLLGAISGCCGGVGNCVGGTGFISGTCGVFGNSGFVFGCSMFLN
jgi:hypothetical protein